MDLQFIQDLYGATLKPVPAPFFQTAWPNPQIPLRSIQLYGHIDNSAWLLRGRDTFFGGEGEPPSGLVFDLPPRGYAAMQAARSLRSQGDVISFNMPMNLLGEPTYYVEISFTSTADLV